MLIEVPFATVSDLEARWRTLSDPEKATAETLLDDASNLILSECAVANVVDDEAEKTVREGTLKRIVCAMVKRAMLAPTDQAPMSQVSVTAGPFGQSGTFANPTGDLYLAKADRRSLPCGQQVAFTVPMGC